eukprot:TRINITY_DN13743_c0_g1_i1.p1 TRINITY_DN13743_c0_g1~~TRINITY_DN13743_c0_g1_i1.p1  ORF type:complete len:1530 (-),score=320.26 TRINITY_DN13743_c0_g1_i1:14-4114(-)
MSGHNSKPFLVCYHDDRSIKVYNTVTGNIMHSFELSDVEDGLKEKDSQSGTSIGKKAGANVGLAALLHNTEMSFLSFHPSKDFLVAAGVNGCALCFDLTQGKDPKTACLGVTNLFKSAHATTVAGSNGLVQVQFHATHPLVLTLDKEGNLLPFYFFPVQDRWALASASAVQPAAVEMKSRYAHVPSYVKLTSELLQLNEMRVHPKLNYFSFTFKRVGAPSMEELKLGHLFDSIRHGFYSLYASSTRTNYVVPQQQPMNFFASFDRDPKTGKPVFLFPNESFFIDGNEIMAYSPAYGDTSLAKSLPTTFTSMETGDAHLRPIKTIYSPSKDKFLVISEAVSAEKEGQVDFVCSVIAKDASFKEIPHITNARDCCWVGNDHSSFAVLNENGKSIELIRTVPGTRNPAQKPITCAGTVAAIFSTPMDNGNRILVHNSNNQHLTMSAKGSLSGEDTRLRMDRSLMIQLGPEETVIQVQWQRTWKAEDPDDYYGAILTNQYLRIVDSQLGVLAQYKDTGLASCIWLGASVLFTTRTHLMFMTLSGYVQPLLSLQYPNTVVMSALCDRVLLVAARAGQTIVMTHAVGLFEPLASGLLELAKCDQNVERGDIDPLLKGAAECYDGKRVSLRLIEDLVSAGVRDLALRMLLANGHLLRIRYDLAWKLAVKTKHMHSAFAILQQPYVYPNDPQRLKRKYKKLAALSMQLGQFDLARKCYEMAGDGPSLIYLASLTDNKNVLERLLSRFKRDSAAAGANEHVVRFLQQRLSILGRSLSGQAISNTSVSATASPTSMSPVSDSVLGSQSPTPSLQLASVLASSSPDPPAAVARSPSDPAILAGTWGVSYLDDEEAPPPPPPEEAEEGSSPKPDAPETGAPAIGASSPPSDSLAMSGDEDIFNDSPFTDITDLSPPSETPQASSPLSAAAANENKSSTVSGDSTSRRMVPRSSSVVASDPNDLLKMIRGSTAESHLLTDGNYISTDEYQKWKMELDARVSCEMRTLPLQRGSGDHVVGPLLITHLLADWFSRQVPYFQLPELLLTDEYKKRSKAQNLEALTDIEDRRGRRTFTVTGMAPGASPSSQPNQTTPAASTSATGPQDDLRRRGMSMNAQPDKVARQPSIMASNPVASFIATRAARTNTILGSGPPSANPSPTDSVRASPSGESDLSLPPIEHLRLAIFRLEKGDYAAAVADTNVCIQILVAKPGIPADVKQRNISAAVCYKFATTLLMEIKKEEESKAPLQRLAYLSLVLARLPVLPRHRIIFMRQAAKRNFDAHNYLLTQALTEELMKKKLPDRLVMEERLTICREKGLKDEADAPPLNPKVCFKTFKRLNTGAKCIKCRYCLAVFADDAVSATSFCPFCLQKMLVVAALD